MRMFRFGRVIVGLRSSLLISRGSLILRIEHTSSDRELEGEGGKYK